MKDYIGFSLLRIRYTASEKKRQELQGFFMIHRGITI